VAQNLSQRETAIFDRRIGALRRLISGEQAAEPVHFVATLYAYQQRLLQRIGGDVDALGNLFELGQDIPVGQD